MIVLSYCDQHRHRQGANEPLSKFIQFIWARDSGVLNIVNADHGSWGLRGYSQAPQKVFAGVDDALIGLDQLGVLLAIRWPNGSMKYGGEIRTNVNLFRHIFANLNQSDALLAN